MIPRQVALGGGLLGVLMVIAGALWYLGPADPTRDEAESAEVWSVQADQVTEIRMVREADTFVVKREGDEWQISEPYVGVGDTYRIRDLINDLSDVHYGRPLEGINADDVGLGVVPTAVVTLKMLDGSEKVLTIGDAAPTGQRTYVRDLEGGIAMISGKLPGVIVPAEIYRDSRIFHFRVQDVTHVEINGPHGILDVTRNADGSYWVKGWTRAEVSKVEDLLMDLLDTRFERFGPPQDLPEAGAGPAYEVTIDQANGPTESVVFGNPSGTGDIFAEVRGGLTGLVTEKALKGISRGPKDVGDQVGFPVDPTASTKLAIVLGDKSFVADKSAEGAWTVSGTATDRVPDILEAIGTATIQYQRDPIPAITEVYGSIVATEGGRERAYDIGQLIGDQRVVRDRAGGEPYFVPEGAIAHIIDVMTAAKG